MLWAYLDKVLGDGIPPKPQGLEQLEQPGRIKCRQIPAHTEQICMHQEALAQRAARVVQRRKEIHDSLQEG